MKCLNVECLPAWQTWKEAAMANVSFWTKRLLIWQWLTASHTPVVTRFCCHSWRCTWKDKFNQLRLLLSTVYFFQIYRPTALFGCTLHGLYALNTLDSSVIISVQDICFFYWVRLRDGCDVKTEAWTSSLRLFWVSWNALLFLNCRKLLNIYCFWHFSKRFPVLMFWIGHLGETLGVFCCCFFPMWRYCHYNTTNFFIKMQKLMKYIIYFTWLKCVHHGSIFFCLQFKLI